jgi:hypothetical protein
MMMPGIKAFNRRARRGRRGKASAVGEPYDIVLDELFYRLEHVER